MEHGEEGLLRTKGIGVRVLREVRAALAAKGRVLPPETVRPRPRSSNMGAVYFIQCGDFIKIGRTVNRVQERLAEFRCGNPYPLTLLATVTAHRSELVQREASYHAQFVAYHHRDEWFRAEPDLLAVVQALQ
jgi:hypothetical protein